MMGENPRYNNTSAETALEQGGRMSLLRNYENETVTLFSEDYDRMVNELAALRQQVETLKTMLERVESHFRGDQAHLAIYREVDATLYQLAAVAARTEEKC